MTNFFSRREAFSYFGAIGTLFLSFPYVSQIVQAAQPDKAKGYFGLGVASGDPSPDGVVLWTRLISGPMNERGMPPHPVPVEWQVSLDQNMERVVRKGTDLATPELAHSVHVEITGLEADQSYWYQFKTADQMSPVGKTRTAPAKNSSPRRIRFGFSSCQHFEHGYFTSHKHLAEENLDFFIFLGDYIYEKGAKAGRPRRHHGGEARTLEEYRQRYTQYKSDLDLQVAHAAFPWIVTWDDHEVVDDYAADYAPGSISSAEFLERRTAAYQAYYENMPLRKHSKPSQSGVKLYRSLRYGDLADIYVLDTRQYRSVQACTHQFWQECEDFNPDATMLGQKQEHWLSEGVRHSTAKWTVIAQQVPMTRMILPKNGKSLISTDKWDGYPVARERILETLTQNPLTNPVVLTGDTHASWVADIKKDYGDPRSAPIATEFIGTSMSSGGDENFHQARGYEILQANPHLKFYSGKRGYQICEITPNQWRTDYREVDYISAQGAAISTRASFLVEQGAAGAKRVY